MKMKRAIIRQIAILISLSAIAASYVKGRADGILDAELKAIDGLMIAKFALEEVSTMEGENKHEWLTSVLRSAAKVTAGARLQTYEELQEVLDEVAEIIKERER